MKLSPREKKLLLILLVVTLTIGYIKYLLEPQWKKIGELSKKKEEYSFQIQNIRKEISDYDRLSKELSNQYAKISYLTLKLYPSIFQEKIIMTLDEQLKKSELTANSISFSEQSVSEVNPEKQATAPQESTLRQFVQIYQNLASIIENKELSQMETEAAEKEETLTRTVERMTASIDYVGTYANLINFLKEVEKGNKITPIKRLDIRRNSEDHTLSGAIDLDYYAVPNLNIQDDEYDSWNYRNKYGKDNPFDLFSGYINPSALMKYDFVMTLNPYSSGLPTIIMGKSTGNSGSGFIYGINQGDEAVELQIHQMEDRYYYKYRTQSDSFPLNYEYEMVEFKPYGSKIELMIHSKKRISPTDQSGILLSLVNQSDLTLQVTIGKDDAQSPRVIIERLLGNIVINKLED